MKKVLYLMAIIAAATVVSCAEKPFITSTVNPETPVGPNTPTPSPNVPVLTITPEGPVKFTANAEETYTFKVTTNQTAWDVSVSPADSWCKLDKSSDGFTLSAEKNVENTEPEEVTVTVIAGDAEPVVFKAYQAAKLVPFTGYITHEGIKKEIAASAYYSDDLRCILYLSPMETDGYKIFDMPCYITIDIPIEMLGKEIDLEKNDKIYKIKYNVNVLQHWRWDYYGTTSGSLKMSAGDNGYFELEIGDMLMPDGTYLSCKAAGAVTTEFDDDDLDDNYSLSLNWLSDVKMGSDVFNMVTYSDLYGFFGPVGPGGLYLTYIHFLLSSGNREMKLEFETFYSEKFLTSGTYNFTEQENIKNKTFTNTCELYVFDNDNSTQYFSKITGGSFDIEISDYAIKLTFNNITHEYPDGSSGAAVTGSLTFDPLKHGFGGNAPRLRPVQKKMFGNK